MKVAIMQPYFLPYLGYFQLINAVDVFVLYDDVNYINKGWINRNNILINNKATLFTIPLSQSSQNKLICENQLVEDEKWKVKFLKTLSYSYNKSPYFKDTYSILEEIIRYNEINLSKYIHYSITRICKHLGIDTKLISSSSIYHNNHLNGQDRIIDICIREDADLYINAIGGKQLYDKSSFNRNNIELCFLETNSIKYLQYGNDFIPNLSIIDLLMFNSLDDIRAFLDDYTLS